MQVKDNAREARIKPLAQLLAGAARARFDAVDEACVEAVGFPCLLGLEDSETGFAGAFGGGLDIN